MPEIHSNPAEPELNVILHTLQVHPDDLHIVQFSCIFSGLISAGNYHDLCRKYLKISLDIDRL